MSIKKLGSATAAAPAATAEAAATASPTAAAATAAPTAAAAAVSWGFVFLCGLTLSSCFLRLNFVKIFLNGFTLRSREDKRDKNGRI